jgi:hypothetical protein
MASHCLVIALLSACPINQRCTAPLFNVIPTIPPFILESLYKRNTAFKIQTFSVFYMWGNSNLFRVCSIVWSHATPENAYPSCLWTVQLSSMFAATSTKEVIQNKDWKTKRINIHRKDTLTFAICSPLTYYTIWVRGVDSPPIWSRYANFKSLFISLEIDCFHRQWTWTNMHSGTKSAGWLRYCMGYKIDYSWH